MHILHEQFQDGVHRERLGGYLVFVDVGYVGSMKQCRAKCNAETTSSRR